MAQMYTRGCVLHKLMFFHQKRCRFSSNFLSFSLKSGPVSKSPIHVLQMLMPDFPSYYSSLCPLLGLCMPLPACSSTSGIEYFTSVLNISLDKHRVHSENLLTLAYVVSHYLSDHLLIPLFIF